MTVVKYVNIRDGKRSLPEILTAQKADIAVFLIIAMLAGFLCSRALASISMMLFGLNSLWNVSPRRWYRDTFWLLGVIWVACYAVSWFWTDDKQTWSTLMQLKLPILLLPAAFIALPPFRPVHKAAITVCMGVMFAVGGCYSLRFFVTDYERVIREYNISHLLPTPVYGDYICFGVSCALYIVWLAQVYPSLTRQWIKALGCSVAIFLAIYLHILASKSGLLALYLFAFVFVMYYAIARKSKLALVSLLVLPAALMLATEYIPTLKERKEHIIYTYSRIQAKDSTGNLGDISRIISYRVAVGLIKERPLTGYGAGDMLHAMNSGYDRWYPAVTKEINRLVPHNQFIDAALACGIPVAIVFAIWVLLPLLRLRRNRESLLLAVVWCILLSCLLIEPFLETQFGVFVYMFYLMLFLHTLPRPYIQEAN